MLFHHIHGTAVIGICAGHVFTMERCPLKGRVLLAIIVAAGLIFAPSAFAQDTAKPAMKNKTHKTAKVHKKANRAPAKIRKNDDMMGSPYSTQKDEMTR